MCCSLRFSWIIKLYLTSHEANGEQCRRNTILECIQSMCFGYALFRVTIRRDTRSAYLNISPVLCPLLANSLCRTAHSLRKNVGKVYIINFCSRVLSMCVVLSHTVHCYIVEEFIRLLMYQVQASVSHYDIDISADVVEKSPAEPIPLPATSDKEDSSFQRRFPIQLERSSRTSNLTLIIQPARKDCSTVCGSYRLLWHSKHTIVNPRRACAARVTVVVLCVCLLSVCQQLFSHYRLRGGL